MKSAVENLKVALRAIGQIMRSNGFRGRGAKYMMDFGTTYCAVYLQSDRYNSQDCARFSLNMDGGSETLFNAGVTGWPRFVKSFGVQGFQKRCGPGNEDKWFVITRDEGMIGPCVNEVECYIVEQVLPFSRVFESDELIARKLVAESGFASTEFLREKYLGAYQSLGFGFFLEPY